MTGKTTTIDDGLMGLWTDPYGLSFNEKPSTSMYQDLSAFMGAMNIPVSWKDDSGLVHDTVNEIGQRLFKKTGPQDLAVLSKSENIIGKVSAEVSAKGGVLHASHVYYPNPMGKCGQHNSLHNAIHLSYTMNTYMVAVSAAQDHLAVINPLSDQNSWIVAMNIIWASGPIAESRDVQERFTVKVQTPADKTPAYAKAAVQAAATAAVNDGGAGESYPAKNTAQVVVTDSSWLPKSS